ncbi:DUF72 domain-containing protein [Sulfidibacter corallicola]|uniref:DUF72 domain-containing protein n=1 Tax=Sulfidibacter corallicola TaxID=2818388 RepID=A0A8A4TRI2_SULCO|nr:DUF72 domain-containing protein [Sulfidibacter corallicola]QTD52576.1 DUF72 domain-containing protein [Sulfidibacter corallicola]
MYELPYYLGCPMWANRDWVGRFFRRDAKPREYLSQYSSALTSVEGNTTFYALPKAETVALWADSVPARFRFCFKFPRVVSHDLALRDAERETAEFFERLSPLGARLGPFFLQLPPSFADMDRLARFLARLPREFRYAVEARHARFYDGASGERDFDAVLTELGMDRVIFDTHRLMRLTTRDPELLEAQRKKPKAPVRHHATGPHPFLRFVGDPDFAQDREILEGWARRAAGWIAEGRRPFIFMHQAPEDVAAPQIARLFHEMLQTHRPEVGDMPPWPIDDEPPPEEQLSLF